MYEPLENVADILNSSDWLAPCCPVALNKWWIYNHTLEQAYLNGLTWGKSFDEPSTGFFIWAVNRSLIRVCLWFKCWVLLDHVQASSCYGSKIHTVLKGFASLFLSYRSRNTNRAENGISVYQAQDISMDGASPEETAIPGWTGLEKLVRSRYKLVHAILFLSKTWATRRIRECE